jgi:hypothetical protein
MVCERKLKQERGRVLLMSTNTHSWLWLAADYHLPATYSCRLPMSSATSAPTSPGPGPATVRLALIRTSIELLDQPKAPALSCESIISTFAACDAHGFLVTAKKADDETETAARQRLSKATLLDFSYALESDFVTRLQAMADETCQVYPFETADSFYALMNAFITASVPALHPFWMTEAGE